MNEEINAGMEPEKSRGHIRGIWAITIIVVVAMLVGGGVWWWYYSTTVQDQTTTNTAKISPSASPSASASALPSTSGSTETADWKTYTDKEYGFSVKYPAKATLNESNTPVESMKWMISFVDSTGCGSNRPCSDYTFVVQAHDNPSKLNATQWVEAKYSSPAELRESLMTSGITVDGAQGERISSTFGDDGFQNVIVQSRTKSNIMFVITLDGISPSLENTFNQFINTFKFL